jgi:hypothetical protein
LKNENGVQEEIPSTTSLEVKPSAEVKVESLPSQENQVTSSFKRLNFKKVEIFSSYLNQNSRGRELYRNSLLVAIFKRDGKIWHGFTPWWH